MRTFLLLALTFVAINATQPDLRKLLLDDIIMLVNHVLNHTDENLKLFVKDIFHRRKCTDNDLCQAAKVLQTVHLNKDPHNMIQRNVFSYANITGHRNCSVAASEEHSVEKFLKEIKACCQSRLSRLGLHPKKVK